MFRSAGRTIIWLVLALVILGAGAFLFLRQDPSPIAPATQPAIVVAPPTTQPTTEPATQPLPPPMRFLEVAQRHYPRLPATQPIGALRLEDAAHVILDDPMHIDGSRTLWIMRDDAAPTTEVLKTALSRQSHVVSENVRYVHWSPDAEGTYAPRLICAREDGTFELVDQAQRRMIDVPADAQWDRAFSWNDRVVVPTRSGVSVFRFGQEIQTWERPFDLADATAENISRPQVILDHRGLLAWMPWEEGKSGSRGAARFVDDQWKPLVPADGWAERPIHLVPLLDGSVLQISLGPNEKIELSLLVLEAPQLDEARILSLVEQLSDPDLTKRTAANAELSRYGPGAWPVLERAMPDQPPEAQGRLGRILANRLKPTLGGMTLIDGKMRLLTRFRDGGVLFFADNGVKRPADRGTGEQTTVPAWICIRPGRPVELLNPWLVHGLHPKTHRIDAIGGEWIVTDEVHGPQRFRGNHLVPLLHKNEREFSELWGIDARGRWLFRKTDEGVPKSTTAPTTSVSVGRFGDAQPTLIIDPTIPAFAPRLPVWNLAEFGEIGWTDDDWPAAKKGSTYVLEARGWRLLKKEEEFHAAQDGPSLKREKPAATTQSTQPAEPPLLIDDEGNQYFDGTETLRVVRANGETIVWTLPPTAAGEAPVTLIRAAGDRLFLFNQSGRVVRIAPRSDGEPYEVEAIFTRKIPSARPARVWRDPAGRIILVSPGGLLSILFPDGWIPTDIRQLMTAQELESIDEE